MNGPTHYELAMTEARRMGRSGSRKKSSRIICHHLLRMLAEEVPEPASARTRRVAPRLDEPQQALLIRTTPISP